jgi:hypothetical protein
MFSEKKIKDFEKTFNGIFIMAILGAVMSLGLMGVIIWAIIRLVGKF